MDPSPRQMSNLDNRERFELLNGPLTKSMGKVQKQEEEERLEREYHIEILTEDFRQERKAREEAQQQIGRLQENLDSEQRERSKVQNRLKLLENEFRNFNKKLDPKQCELGNKLLQSFRRNEENDTTVRVPVQEGGPALEPQDEVFPVQRAPQTALSSVVAAPSNVVDINRISPDILAMIIEKKDANDLQRDIKDPDAVADKAFEARLITPEELATVMNKESQEEKTTALLDIMEKKEPGLWEQEFRVVLCDLEANCF